jgi:hypothetical protein
LIIHPKEKKMIQAVEQIMTGTDAARFIDIPARMRQSMWRIIAVPVDEEPVQPTYIEEQAETESNT